MIIFNRIHNAVFYAAAAILLAGSIASAAETAEADCNDQNECVISCIEPDTACKDSQEVVDTLRKLVAAYIAMDLDTVSQYIAEDCTTFNESTKELIAGKQNVLNNIKSKFELHGPGGSEPLEFYRIEHPYARVDGDEAVVTFVAVKKIKGPHARLMKSNVTDIFIKEDGLWKKLHYRGNWKEVKPESKS